MATAEDYFPSNYVKCSDLAGKEHVVTIAFVKDEVFENDGKQQKKPVVYFKQKFKPLVCNKTNFLTIADCCGKDTDSWAGKQIILFPSMVNMPGGKVTEAVRVKRVPLPASVELNDTIPF